MSVVLCKMKKYKIHQVVCPQQHNQREPDNYEDASIDYTKSYLNYELHQKKK
ncbi:plasmid recombination protein [Bacillus sp. GMs2/2]|uniref:plasmid recombination protein n=1 Tax=Bacillus sp. GMs2/2 TaxID=3418494 RepID=UPI003CF8B3B0